MMEPSGGYAAWCHWLDAFARAEDLDTARLVPVDGSLGPAMFERLVQRINAAFVARVEHWNRVLNGRLEAATASGRGIAEVEAVLLGARLALRPIFALTESVLLLESLRAELRRVLVEALTSLQRSLEDSVRHQTSHRDDLLAVIRNQSLTRPVPPAASPATPGPPAGRSVLL
jgi:hypothetical protein